MKYAGISFKIYSSLVSRGEDIMELETAVFIIFNIALGTCMGSFLNVVASRTMEDKSWWGKERSECPHCGTRLVWKDLVPILSYIFLRGKCRYCKRHIPARYFIVEIAGGLAGGLLAWRWGFSYSAVIALITGYGLLLNSTTDLYSGYIYDLYALIPGFICLLLRIAGGLHGIMDGVEGALLGFGVIAAIILISRGGMGWGDASLMAGVGAALGWKMTAVALYLGFMVGGTIAIALLLLKIVKRKDAIALGPFLATGGFLSLLCGPYILAYFCVSAGWPWF